MKKLTTFGVRYNREEHPVDPSITDKGVLEVEFDTDDYGEFRRLIAENFGMRWAFDYYPDELNWEFHPYGVTHRLDEKGFRQVKKEQ